MHDGRVSRRSRSAPPRAVKIGSKLREVTIEHPGPEVVWSSAVTLPLPSSVLGQQPRHMEALAAIPVLIILGLVLVLAVLAVLLPVFVANIASRTAKLVEQSTAQTDALKAIQRTMENANTAQQMHGNKNGDELEANNALLRQLVRAYGHEPEN